MALDNNYAKVKPRVPLKPRVGSLTLGFTRWSFVVSWVIIVGVLLFATIVPFFTGDAAYRTDVTVRLQGPSVDHVFGVDEFGRDIFARIAEGARNSILVGFAVASISTVLGLVIGVLAAYYRPLDQILMRVADGLMAIPGVLLALSLSAILGPSISNLIIALSVVFTPMVSRVVRSQGLSVKTRSFVEAAFVAGARDRYIMIRHIAPNVLAVLSVQATYVFADTVIIEAALSFLGAGVPPPSPSWGNILHAGKDLLHVAPHMIIVPSIFLVVTVMSLNLFGDGIRDLTSRQSSVGRQKVVKNLE